MPDRDIGFTGRDDFGEPLAFRIVGWIRPAIIVLFESFLHAQELSIRWPNRASFPLSPRMIHLLGPKLCVSVAVHARGAIDA